MWFNHSFFRDLTGGVWESLKAIARQTFDQTGELELQQVGRDLSGGESQFGGQQIERNGRMGHEAQKIFLFVKELGLRVFGRRA